MSEVSQKTKSFDYSGFSSDRKIMLFDLSSDGHHPGYIQHLIQFWGEQDLPGSLNIVVSPKFIQQHTHIVDLASLYGQGSVNFVPIAVAEEAAFFLAPVI